MNRINIFKQQPGIKINRHIYGHFSEHLGRCIYGGYWVGNMENSIPNTRGIRNDIVEALKKIKIPNLRWPGGCFADEYHWMDGIGPAEQRPKMVNTHWGGVTEDNSFGTHEFLDLCEQLGCEPYICGNVGSGTVSELSQWAEYCNFDGISPMAQLRRKNRREDPWKVKFWGIGNESWGCGGNMGPDFYADNYRRYATYVRHFGGTKPYKIACGPNSADYNWTRVLMEKAGGQMDGLSLHYYTLPGSWKNKGSAVNFSTGEWFTTLKKTSFMEELIKKHSAIMDEFDPEKKVSLIVDEWGAWYDVEPGSNPGFLFQQNSLRDALIAGINLNIFNNKAERVQMANIAQTVNVLQALVLTDGPQMLLTPTYHVFDMYKVHQDAEKLQIKSESETAGEIEVISASASVNSDKRIHISITNADPAKETRVHIEFKDFTLSPSAKINGKIITSEKINDHNTFNKPDTVKLKEFTGVKISGSTLIAGLPPRSVVTLELS